MTYGNTHNLADLSDRDLVLRIRQGDAAAFDVLMERYHNGLMNVVTGNLDADLRHSVETRDEVCAMVWERIFIALCQTFDPAREFSPYLWKTARNVCYDVNQKQHRHESRFTSLYVTGSDDDSDPEEWHAYEVPCPRPNPRELAIRSETQELVRAILEMLAPPYREVLRLRFFQGLSVESIARELKLSCEGVKTRLRRGKAEFRTQMQLWKATKRRGVPPGKHRQGARSRARRTAVRLRLVGQRFSQPGSGAARHPRKWQQRTRRVSADRPPMAQFA